MVHSSGIFRGKIAPGTSSSLKVILSDLFFSRTLGNAISELIFRKRNPFRAVFLDRGSEFNIRIINSLLHS